jgi:endonuclease/exonuclease/phosphatase family metal-dependent hydrolase
VRLVSFNLAGGRGEHGRGDPALIGAALADLDADVLALQEVDRFQPRSRGADQAAAAAIACGVSGEAHVRFEPTLWGTPGTGTASGIPGDPLGPSYGVALVSRLPVRAWRRVDLPWAPVSVPVPVGGRLGRRTVYRLRDEPRVGLAAVLAEPSPVATVVTTHLSFLPGVNAVQLRRLVAAVRDLPRPLVLLGDLNLPAAATRVLLPRWRGLGGGPTFPAHDPRLRLDQVLVHGRGPAAGAATTVRTGVSDHRALRVTLARP